ncbi:MAG TPA: hypothetical protein VGF60_15045 [Xanthobacteraceae bacterium]|jgi:hypothetical protein
MHQGAYDELVGVAQMCIELARGSQSPEVAAELERTAKGYRLRAASLEQPRDASARLAKKRSRCPSAALS